MKRYLNYLKNRKGQGTTEYIVILAIAVGIVMSIFWPKIRTALTDKTGKIVQGIEKAGD
jgi:F0F1-type ATP synthase membrane subunit b/b'